MTGDGSFIVAGSIIGVLLGWAPGAIIGALTGSAIQELIKCPKCGNRMKWNHELKRYICEACYYK